MEQLTLATLKQEAGNFINNLGNTSIPQLYGITDGKAVGTYVEQKFKDHLSKKYSYVASGANSGIDFPELAVDLKVTAMRQPQSSCPFRDASQKVYGLGYHLLICTYEKIDNQELQQAILNFQDVIFVNQELTGDYLTTKGLRNILANNGNQDDIVAFLEERNLPLDEIGRYNLAERIISQPPMQGYITISNALQWRLQYSRIIQQAETAEVSGIEQLIIK